MEQVFGQHPHKGLPYILRLELTFRVDGDVTERIKYWFELCNNEFNDFHSSGVQHVSSLAQRGLKRFPEGYQGGSEIDNVDFSQDATLIDGRLSVDQGSKTSVEYDGLWVGRGGVPYAYLECLSTSPTVSQAEIGLRLRAILARYCDRFPIQFAYISGGDNVRQRTALEVALRRPWPVALEQVDQVLRGYSWVTVIPKVLAPVVLPRVMDDSLLVANATESGDLLVQAGDTFDDYDDSRMSALFKCLAPVLPDGTPVRNEIAKSWPDRFVDRDAREVAKFHSATTPRH